jgi:hypothetical protein
VAEPVDSSMRSKLSGLFRSFFGDHGFEKVRESTRTLELFEHFDVQFQKWWILLVFVGILVQIMLVFS